MREAGLVVARALSVLAAAAEPGVSTADLDAIAEREITGAGATPSFKGYHGYPATICTSVNEEIVHGIPGPARRLRDGDIISIDCGAIVGGWHGDAALTVGVGEISDELRRLLAACEQALWQGLAQARPGRRLSDISHAVERSARAAGPYGIVEEYVGHGIGTEMHMDPAVPNYGRPGRGPLLVRGMALAIEPMLVLGARHTRLLDDDWTVVSADGTPAAHFEHTVAITADGPWVLTAPDGGRVAGLAAGQAEPAGPRRARPARPEGDDDASRPAGCAPPTPTGTGRRAAARAPRRGQADRRGVPGAARCQSSRPRRSATSTSCMADLPGIDLYHLPDESHAPDGRARQLPAPGRGRRASTAGCHPPGGRPGVPGPRSAWSLFVIWLITAIGNHGATACGSCGSPGPGARSCSAGGCSGTPPRRRAAAGHGPQAAPVAAASRGPRRGRQAERATAGTARAAGQGNPGLALVAHRGCRVDFPFGP